MRIEELSKTYPGVDGTQSVHVFEGLDFMVGEGRFVSIVGPNGCGKTTLLKVIAGLEPATAGRVSFNGDGGRDREGRRHIGMVFQESALFPWRTALENIEIGLEFAAVPRKSRRQMALGYMANFGMKGFEDKYPWQLSGGMRQRVAIARTLVTEPDVVLMDEPFAALDAQTRNRMQDYLLDVWRQRGDTVLFVTHNVDEAVYLSDRIVILSNRPARLLNVIDIDLDRPRNRVDARFCQIRKNILDVINPCGE